MRCKKHYTDLSSTVGVCACCLRERLVSLVAAEEQVQVQVQNLQGKHSNSEKILAFPPSVSPQKSDAPRYEHSQSDQLRRTPEVVPATGGNLKQKRSLIRLLCSSNIFRSRNRKSVDSISNPRASDSTVRESCGSNNATSSSSWFSSIMSGGRRRRKQSVCTDKSTITAGGRPIRPQHFEDRGMSPVRNLDVDGGDEELCSATSEYESTGSWKNTPRRTPGNPPVRRVGGGGHVRSISNLTFCLSPLVRTSPNRQWNQKGLPPDVVLSGEIGAPVKHHRSGTNRSRKLADFGRANQNR